MKPWRLADLSLHDVRSAQPIEVAILPLGATEPHNLHLPHATDTLQVELVADESARIAHAAGARVLVLPAMPYGTETNLMRFPLAINVNPTTLAAVIRDVIDSLEAHGIRKLLLLNGHGGNDLKWLLRELHGKTPVHLFLCNWYKVAADAHAELFKETGDHAGEMETSMGLAFFPELVRMDRADAGATRPTRFEAINRGWVEITRPWHLLTTNSGAGDPRAARAEQGRRELAIVSERIATFLAELSSSKLDEGFPY